MSAILRPNLSIRSKWFFYKSFIFEEIIPPKALTPANSYTMNETQTLSGSIYPMHHKWKNTKVIRKQNISV